MPKVWLSSTVMTPSLPTFSMASAMMAADLGVGGRDGGDLGDLRPWTRPPWRVVLDGGDRGLDRGLSMPFFSDIGLAPAATLRRPSRTMAQASTVAVVVPSPATSSVFLATSLTSSAPIFS